MSYSQPSIGYPRDNLPPHKLPACIACGVNFSEGGMGAVDVAASVARMLHEPLLLIQASESTARQSLPADLKESLRRFSHERLEETANHLRATGIPLITAFHSGEPAVSLLAETTEHSANLLVLGAPLEGGASRRLLLEVGRETSIPTLVVRQPEPLRMWLSGERELRVLIGIDFSSASWTALRWVKWLRELGSCDVTVAVLEPKALPPAGAAIHCRAEAEELARRTTTAQERFFRRLVETLLGRPRLRVRFEYGFVRSDAHFIELAREVRADLVVLGVGTSGAGAENDQAIWPGVLRYGSSNVALIPGRLDAGEQAHPYPISEQARP